MFFKKRRLGHRLFRGKKTCKDERRRQPSTSQRERPQKTPNLPAPWSQTYSLQNCETSDCCLSHATYDILLRQPNQTNTMEFSYSELSFYTGMRIQVDIKQRHTIKWPCRQRVTAFDRLVSTGVAVSLFSWQSWLIWTERTRDYLLGDPSWAKNMKSSNYLENRAVLNSIMPANSLKLRSNIAEPRWWRAREGTTLFIVDCISLYCAVLCFNCKMPGWAVSAEIYFCNKISLLNHSFINSGVNWIFL